MSNTIEKIGNGAAKMHMRKSGSDGQKAGFTAAVKLYRLGRNGFNKLMGVAEEKMKDIRDSVTIQELVPDVEFLKSELEHAMNSSGEEEYSNALKGFSYELKRSSENMNLTYSESPNSDLKRQLTISTTPRMEDLSTKIDDILTDCRNTINDLQEKEFNTFNEKGFFKSGNDTYLRSAVLKEKEETKEGVITLTYTTKKFIGPKLSITYESNMTQLRGERNE